MGDRIPIIISIMTEYIYTLVSRVFIPYNLKAYMDLMSRDADAENTDSMLRNSVKFIVPGLDENTTHIRPANGFSCRQI